VNKDVYVIQQEQKQTTQEQIV